MKNTHFYIIVLLSLLIVTASCTKFTDGINEDPNSFSDAPGPLLIGQANLTTVKIFSSQASRISGIWTDQFTGSDRQYIPLNDYTTTAGDYDDDWSDVYAGGLAQARLAELDAIKTGDALLEGVSLIIQGILIGETASIWGDVPWTEALQSLDIPNPKYDSQASVLDAAQGLLSDGISKVGGATVSDFYGAPVFVANDAGNDATWKEVANSMKARYYLVAKDYANALIYANMGISSPSGDFLSAHAEETGAKNLYYQFCKEQREGYLTATGSHLNKLVNGLTPRVLATPGEAQRALVYFDGDNLNTNTGGFFAIDASFPIISYFETKLIQAEAAHRTGGDALTPFNEVRAALATLYSGDFPASTSSGAVLLNEILEEKYITLIGSNQVFHDVRRTNNLIGVPIKNTSAGNTTIPQRFLYPQSEVNANANFPGFVDLFEPTPVNQ